MGGDASETTLTDIRDYIAREVAAGFYPPASVVDSAVEMFSDDVDPDILGPIVERLAREAIAAHLQAQATWPEVTDCDRLDDAMGELTRGGIVCRQNFSCCGPCGEAEIGAEMEAEREAGLDIRGYAFYHLQDTEAATEGRGLNLHYGAVEEGEAATLRIGHEIIDALQRHGLNIHWNQDPNTRIKIHLDWKRRLPQGAWD